MTVRSIKIEAARGIVAGGIASSDTLTADLAVLTAAVAAAQLIGAGDASAEIDAIDTAAQAVDTTAVALQAESITVSVDSDVTREQLLKALDAAFKYFTAQSGFIT